MTKNEKLHKVKEALGIPSPDVKIFYPKKLFEKLDVLIEKQEKKNTQQMDILITKVSESFDAVIKKLSETDTRLDSVEKVLEKYDGLKEVKVNNWPEQKEVVVEQKEVIIPPFPSVIDIKKPTWYREIDNEKIYKSISSIPKILSDELKEILERYEHFETPFAVRLVDRDASTFYNAIATAVGGSVVTAGLATEATLAALSAKITNPLPVASSLETGTVYQGTTARTPAVAFVNIAASQTDSSIVSALGAGIKIRVIALWCVAGATATNITFNSKPAGAGTAISALMANAANGGTVLPFNPVGWFTTSANEGLTATTGAGSTTGVHVVYIPVT